MQIPVLFNESGAHISPDGNPLSSSVTATAEELASTLHNSQKRLREISLDDIIGLLDAAAQAWVQPDHSVTHLIKKFSLDFLLSWLRRKNLENVCDKALRGNREASNNFVPMFHNCRELHHAQPRGICMHWVAGNVPLLGMISVIQGLLGKNANIVKVSRKHAGILPLLLEQLSKVCYRRTSGVELRGNVLTDAVRAIFFTHHDYEVAQTLSLIADVRVAWGGQEAVESVMNLPRRFGTEDIIFGPKTSFAVIGSEMLKQEKSARHTAHLLALDTVALEQRGCNSPHTIFVEYGAAISPIGFAELLAEELRTVCEQRPAPVITAQEAFQVLTCRTEYDIRGTAWYGDDISWSVLYSEEDQGLADPCYARTLFVRPVQDVFDIVPLCSIKTQTAALALKERRLKLADALTAHGVERCPQPGRMSLYESPWDGMYPIDRMVRWVSA